MTTTSTDDLPGVVLHLAESSTTGTASNEISIRVVMTAQVRNEALWEEVREKLDGLKIYTSVDFKGELLDALRADYSRLQQSFDACELALERLKLENATLKAALRVPLPVRP